MSKGRSLLFICLLCLLSLIYYSIPPQTLEFTTDMSSSVPGEVLLFAATPIFGKPMDNSFLEKCTEEKKFCRISTETDDHSRAAAVLFHSRDFREIRLPRRKEQVYVWFTSESPVYETVSVPQNYINWTMSYRKDSDIWNPYNRMEPVEQDRTVDWDSIWKKKTKTATWLASNCVTDNRRAQMVHQMVERGLEVDLWGNCGSPLPNCSRYSGLGCATDLLRYFTIFSLPFSKYKFYLALENSNCPDYLTEKFWNSLTLYWAVPIVMKRRFYTNYEIPESSFIAVDDFSSIDEMVSYIERVSGNRTAYMEHHSWRRTYRVVDDFSTGFCELCRHLKNNSLPHYSYKDLSSWFSVSTCDQRLGRKYLGWSTTDSFRCYVNSLFYPNSYWSC